MLPPDIAAAQQTTVPIRIADTDPIGLSAPRSARSRKAEIRIVAEVGRVVNALGPEGVALEVQRLRAIRL